MKNIIYLTILLFFIFSKNINAQLHINSGATIKTSGNVILTLQDINLNNEGALETSLGSTIVLKENNATSKQNFGGSGTFYLHNLKIERNNFDAKLTTSITLQSHLDFSSGKLDLNGNDITLIGNILNENESRRLIGPNGGVITKTLYLFEPSYENVGNLGAEITSNADLGFTTITRGHVPKTLPAGDSFERYYEISPDNNSGLNATLKLFYFDAENPSIAEANLELWKYSSGEGWTQQDGNNKNTNQNFIRKNGIDGFSTWTFAGANNVDNDGDGISILEGDCDDTNPVEVMDLTLNNIPIAEDYYIVSNQITSMGTVPANETTTFQAGMDIQLQVGFIATEGTNFRAFIVECGVPPAPLNVITENEVEEIKQKGKEDISELETDSKYQVFPNPISTIGNVQLDLEKTATAEVLLYDQIGRLVKTILPLQIKTPNTYHLKYTVEDLTVGIYFIKINLEEKNFTEKVVVIKND